jgi:tetratricopeptide (TPR) repeat protein
VRRGNNRQNANEEEAMKTRTLSLALAGTLVAGLAVAADLPARDDSERTLSPLPPARQGDVLSARKDWAAARDAYREAIAESATLYNKLGICSQRLGDVVAAGQAYRTAVELRPDYAEAWNNLGTLHHTGEDYAGAVAAYEKSIAIDPTDPVVYKNLGQAWLALEEIEKTLEAWSQAMRLDPTVLTSSEKDSILAGQIDLARKYYIYAKLVAADGDVDTALELLGMAREHGFRDFGKVESDPDFTSVVQDPRWTGWAR